MSNVSLICGIKNKTNLTEQKETDREETRGYQREEELVEG